MTTSVPGFGQEELDGVRLLSFDGGDLRAVSQLLILDEFMRSVEEDNNSTTGILPCDYFHMMAGVGTGGVITVLLAVLRLGIEDAITEFTGIWDCVFADASLGQLERSAKLEIVFKDLLKRRGMMEGQKIVSDDQHNSSCKAFVCAIPESNLGLCENIRTYASKDAHINPSVIEAIRATCAIPALFTPVNIQSAGCQISYISGAYNFNNPASEMLKEACRYFGRSRRVACLFSLGCGQRAIMRLVQDNYTTLRNHVYDFASDCERVDSDLGWRIGDSNVYYRLSVNRVLDPGSSSENAVGCITSCTQSFLEHHETLTKMKQCVQASERVGCVTLRDVSGVHELRPVSVHGLPSLSQYFVERPALIKAMAQCLFRVGPLAQRRIVLSGLGGIGKTQITISFLLRYLPRFRHILFIDGSSVQSIESGLVTKVKSLGATYSRSSAKEALEVLANPDYEITRDWAIVYDNVDDPDLDIGHYFPTSPFGTIIITTRNPNLGNLAPNSHLRLDVMSEEESSDVLIRSAIDPSREPTEVEREQAREIAKELGYLPVALVQAGYFIKVYDCMHDYRERLREERPEILGRPARYQLDTHYHAVYATLNVTWPYLTPRAQMFMSILGFVNYTGFPIVLLYRATERGFLFEPFKLLDRSALFQQAVQLLLSTFRPKKKWNKQAIDDLVAELEQYSLVARMATFKVATLRLHPLVHSWTQDRLSPEEKEIYKAAAVRLLVCGTGADDEDIYEFIYPHISMMSHQLCDLHINDRAGLATVLAQHGDTETAIELWEGVQREVRVEYGRDDLCSGKVDLQLARLYRNSRDEEKRKYASVLESEVVEIRTRTHGPDHPEGLEAIVQQAHTLALCYPNSRKDHAQKVLRGALYIREKYDGAKWEAVLQTKEALSLCCDPEESVRLCTEILQTRMERNGLDHHATLKAMENLAKKYWSTSSVGAKSATDTWNSLVAARASRRGREHPDTLDAMQNLARSYEFQQLYDISLGQLEDVIRSRERVQGPDHNDTFNARRQLAQVYERRNNYTEAEVQWKRIVLLTKETHGPTHKNTLTAMRGLASMYAQSKNYSMSEVQWMEILHVTTEARGPRHKDTLDIRRELARMYENSKQFADAEAQWKEILRVIVEAKGPRHKDTIDTRRELARMYENSTRDADAEVQWKEIVLVATQAGASNHEDTLEAMSQLASFYERSNEYDKLETQRKEIARLTEETRGSGHVDTIEAIKTLAKLYEESGKYAESALLWEEIVHSMGVGDSSQRRTLLDPMRELARIYEKAGCYAEAESQWKEIVRALQEYRPPRYEDIVEAMRGLAWMYENSEQYEKAEMQWKEIMRLTERFLDHQNILHGMKILTYEPYEDLEMRWKDILRVTTQTGGPRHKQTLSARRNLARMYEKSKRYAEAEIQWKEIVRVLRAYRPPSYEDNVDAMTGPASLSTGTLTELTSPVDAMRELGSMYNEWERYEDAEAVLVDAINLAMEDNSWYLVDEIRDLLEDVRSKTVDFGGYSSDATIRPRDILRKPSRDSLSLYFEYDPFSWYD